MDGYTKRLLVAIIITIGLFINVSTINSAVHTTKIWSWVALVTMIGVVMGIVANKVFSKYKYSKRYEYEIKFLLVMSTLVCGIVNKDIPTIFSIFKPFMFDYALQIHGFILGGLTTLLIIHLI